MQNYTSPDGQVNVPFVLSATTIDTPPAKEAEFRLARIYAFRAGEWRELDDDPLCQYLGPGESPDRGWSPGRAFERAGYSTPTTRLGIEATGLVVRQAVKATPLSRTHRFAVEVSVDLDDVDVIYVADLPSLIQILPALVAIRQLAQADGIDEALLDARRAPPAKRRGR